MLQLQHRVVVDPAFCLHEKEIIFFNDILSTDLIDIGSIDITNRGLKESSFTLDPFQSNLSTAQLPPHLGNGLLHCKSKLIAYTTAGLFSCYDTLDKRPIFSRGLLYTGMKTSRTVPTEIWCSCSSRQDDDIAFFALNGETSVFVMHFSGRNILRGQQSPDRCDAMFTPPIKVDPHGINKGLAAMKGGIVSMKCHPTLPYIFILGSEGIFVWCYTALLQRLNLESASSGSTDRSFDEGNTNQEEDDESDNGTGAVSAAPKHRLSRALFRRKSVDRALQPDLILSCILVPPERPQKSAVPLSRTAFKMCIHAGGAFAGVSWKWSGDTPDQGATSTCVYDIRLQAMRLPSQSSTPLSLKPIAMNEMEGTGSGTKLYGIQAVFSICFHPTEPILLVGLISRLAPGCSRRQLVTLCSLSLLEPSMRLLSLQNIDPPELEVQGPSGVDGSMKDRDSHATDILCESSGGYVLVTFRHSETDFDDMDGRGNRRLLRPVTVLTYSLSEVWRRAHGCSSSLSVITQLSLPMNSCRPAAPGVEPRSPEKRSNSSALIHSVHSARSVTYAGCTVVAVRPIAAVSLSGTATVSRNSCVLYSTEPKCYIYNLNIFVNYDGMLSVGISSRNQPAPNNLDNLTSFWNL
jgi:hypothetical protein